MLNGRLEITENYSKVFEGQELRQRVENEVISEGRLALTVAAEYPDGKHELCTSTAELDEDGKIVRHMIVLVRDE